MLKRTQALLSRWFGRNARAAARQQQVVKRRKSFLEPLEGRNLLATFHVALTGNDLNDGNIGTPFRTIQAAITAASATSDGDDFVKVATGVYNTVGVDQRFFIGSPSSPPAGLSNLQLLGGWDATFTTRNPAATPTDYTFTNTVNSATRYDIPLYHPNTTIDGFTFRSSDGTTRRESDTLQVEAANVTFSNNIVHVGIRDGGSRPTGVVTSTLNNSIAGLQILNNQFHANFTGTLDGNSYAQGIFLNPTASSGVTISGNSFQGNNFAAMLTVSSVSGVSIDSNTFTRTGPSGFQAISVREPVNPPGAISNISITDNIIDGAGISSGIQIGSSNNPPGSTLPLSGVDVSGNSISNTTAAIVVGPFSSNQLNSITATIANNNFSTNGVNLYYTPLGAGGSTTINGASINPGSNTVTASTTADQDFKLVRSGGNLEVYDVTVPASPALILSQAIGTAALTITGAASFDNTLTVDFTGGNPIPSGGLVFDGGAGGNDSLVILGGNQGNVTYNYTNATDGSIVMQNFGTVTYTGLEPITNTGTAADVIFNLPAGGNVVTLGDDGTSGNGLSRLSSTPATFELTDFANPTGSVTINGGSGAETFTINALPDFNASLTINGQGGTDSIALAAALTLGSPTSNGNLSFTAETISLGGNINTDASTTGTHGNVSFTGPVTLTSNVTIDTDGAGTDGGITFTAAVSGTTTDAQSLSLAAGGGSISTGSLATGPRLLGVTVSSANNLTTGAITTGSGGLNVVGTGTASFGAAIQAINAGLISINSPNISATSNVQTSGAGHITFTHSGALTVGGTVTLGASATLTDNSTGTGTITGAISGGLAAATLVKNNGGTLTLGGVNTFTGAINIAGGTLLYTSNTATIASPISISSGATLQTDSPHASNLTFNGSITNNGTIARNANGSSIFNGPISGTGTINSAAAGGLTLNGNNSSFSGAVTFAGAGGGTNTLTLGHANALGTGTFTMSSGQLQISVANLVNAGNNPIVLGGNWAFQGSNNLNLGTGPVSGTAVRTLTINTGLNLTLGGNLSGGLGITKAGAGTLILNGTNVNTGATTVNAGTLVINGSMNGNVTVNSAGTLNGNGTITGNVSGAGTFSPGNSPGTMNIVGSFSPSGTVNFEVNSPWTAAGTDFDRYNVTGTVNLTGATITFTNVDDSAAPAALSMLTLINNDGTGDLTTAAANPLNGATVTIGTRQFRLFYNGGDGNDVVLVEASSPTVVYVEDTAWNSLASGAIIADADFSTVAAEPAIYGVNAFNTIQAAVNAVAASGTVIVNAGSYLGNVSINKNLALRSTSGRAATTIQGVPIHSQGNGAVHITGTTSGVTLGGVGQGFTIIGFDDTNPAQEDAAVRIMGTHSSIQILDNEIRADGEAGLLAEFGASINGILVSGNEFSGQTFVGAQPAGSGFGDQFSLHNVPRQLVTFGNGGGGGASSVTNMTFTNNLISGTAGGISSTHAPAEQGNTLVTLDVSSSTISGNTFEGTTTRFGSALRVRRPSTTISGNTFDSSNMSNSTNLMFIQNNAQSIQDIIAANLPDRGAMLLGGDTVWPTIQAAVLAAPISGGTVRVLPKATDYVESVNINNAGGTLTSLTLEAPGGSVTVNPASGNAFTIPSGVTARFTDTFTTLDPVVVLSGGTIGGDGTLTGPVTINAGGFADPGFSPGIFASGNYTQSGTLNIEIVRPAATQVPGVDFDQWQVTGTVTLGGPLNLVFTGAGTIADFTSFKIIDNDGTADPVSGVFTGLANGATFTANGQNWAVYYNGGDGNDVVLVTVPLLTPTVTYAEDLDWAGYVNGQFILDADFTAPGNQSAVFGYDAFSTIQAAVNAVANAGTVIVNAGTFGQDASLSGKTGILLQGAGAATTSIVGQLGGANETLLINQGQTVDGFTITRVTGPGENNFGVTFTTGATGMTLRNSVITGNRTGIYVNGGNSSATITRNVINDNRTGFLFPDAAYGNYQITENQITSNKTFGILIQPAVTTWNASSAIFNNNISGNFASQLENSSAAATVNASGNWWGTTAPTLFSGSVNALIGVDPQFNYPGPAVQPGAPYPYYLSGTNAAGIDFTPYLNVGTDTGPATPGFQGDYSNLIVHTAAAQSGAVGRIQEGVNLATSGGMVQVRAGAYAGNVLATGNSVTIAPGASPGQVTINGNLTLDANDTLTIEVNGTNPATDYDNFIVNGVVTLNGAALSITGTYVPLAADSFALIANDLADAVSGTFDSLPAGTLVNVNGTQKRIFYTGNDGNDVVLASATPTTSYVSNTLWAGYVNGQFILDADAGTAGDQSAIFNYNAFDTIAAAQAATTASGTIIVNAGTYGVAVVGSGTQTIEITGPNLQQNSTFNSLATVAGQNVIIEGTSILTIGDATSTTIAGVISGSGSLTKLGVGAVTLSGVNTYSGGTILGNTTGNVSSTGTATAGSGGFILVTNNSSLGSGLLTARGAQLRATTGGIVLPNDINLEAGSLRFGGANDLELAGTVTLIAANRGIGNYSVDRTLLLSGPVINSGFEVHLNAIDGAPANGTTHFSGAISGAGALILASDFDNALGIVSGNNSYGGSTTVNEGILNVRHNNGLGSTAAGTTVAGGATLQLQGGITIGAEALTLAGAGETGQTGALVNVQDTNTYGGTISVGVSTTISSNAGLLNLDVASGNSINLTGSNLTVSLSAGGGSIDVKDSIGGFGGTNQVLELTGSGAGSGTVSGAIASGAGAGAVIKTGTGTWTLTNSSNNWSTGGLNISNGTLVVGAANVIPDGAGKGDVVVTSPGVLDVRFNDTINGLSGNGTVDNTSAAAATLTVGGNNTTSSFSGVMTDSGSSTLAVLKTGTGSQTLSGNNSYTGGTTVSQGAIVASHSNALGTAGTVVINDASTAANNTSLLIDSSAGTVNIGRAISVANQGTGVVTIGTSASAGSNQSIFSGAITLAKAVTLQGAPAAGDRTQFSGGIGGTGNVTIGNNPQRVIFTTTANTYSGNTTINSGSTLQLSDGSATATSLIPDSSLVTVNGTLNLAKGTNNETIGGLAGTGTVQSHPSVASVTSTLTIGNGLGATFSGVLSNGGAAGATLALVKSGAGSQTLAGGAANTYTGLTSVTAGTLTLNKTNNIVSIPNDVNITGGSLVVLTTGQFHSSNTDITIAGGTFDLQGSGFRGSVGRIIFQSGTVTDGDGTINSQINVTANTNAAFSIRGGLTFPLNLAIDSGNANGITYDATGNLGSSTLSGAVTLANATNKNIFVNDSTATDMELIITGNIGDFPGANHHGFTKLGTGVLALHGTNSYSGVTNVNAGTLLVNGSLADGPAVVDVVVGSTAVLGGTGSIAGSVTVNSGGTLHAGSPVTTTESLATGNLLVSAGGVFTPTINGTTVVSQYDQVDVTGTVTLTGSTLTLQGTHVPNPSVAESFVIIANDDVDAVVGTFDGLPEGSPITPAFNGETLFISYAGGDGNDVVLYSQPTVNGTAGADTLVLRRFSPTENEYSLNGAAFVQVTNTLPFVFNGLANTDLMLVDTSNGDPIPTGNAAFNGELLRVQKNTGVASDALTYVPSTTAGSGTVSHATFGDVLFTGTTNVDFVNVTTVSVQTATVNDTLSLADGNTATNGIAVPAGYSIAAAAALSINGANAVVGLRNVTNANLTTVTGGGNGNDSVTINSGTGAHGIANLAIATGTGTDTVTVTGGLTVSGNIDINSQNIAVNNTLTGGGTSTVTLNAGGGAITTSGAGVDVVAQDLVASATTGIDLDTTVLNITATSSGTGNVNIDETNGANVLNVSAATGTATVTSTTGNLNLTTISASTTVTLTATAGSITDANAAANNITATAAMLSAATGIGSGNALETTLGSLTANNATSGNIEIAELDAITLASVVQTTDNDLNDIVITAGGTITIGVVNAGTANGDVTLTATAGSIIDNVNDATADVIGDIVTLTAVAGVGEAAGFGSLDTTANSLDVSVTAAGLINLNETNAVTLTDIDTQNGPITIIAAGTITATDVASTTDVEANDISITATTGNIVVGVITAGANNGDVTLLATTGTITDNLSDAVADVIGDVVTMTAASAVGELAGFGSLDTTANFLDVSVTSAGSVFINETNAVTLSDVDTQNGSITITAAGTITATDVASLTDAANVITLTTTTGNILVNLVTAVGDTVVLNSAGAIEEVTPSDGTADVIADVLTMTAVNGIGGGGTIEINTITTASRGLTASVTSAGPIDLLDTTGGLRILSATTANGPITIAATTGSIIAESAVSTTNSDANDITLTAFAGSIEVGTINASSAGDVFLTASAAITDIDATNPDITADDIVLVAGAGVGTSVDPLETSASNLESSGGTGGVFVANTGSLTIGGILVGVVGLSATGGSINVTTTGAMTVTENVTATGAGTSVSLTAIDAMSAGQNFLLNAGVTISSALSSVTLNAGDNATISGNVSSGTITTINVDFADAESAGATATVGDGGTLTITGVITTPNTAAGGAFLNGGNDYDTFTFNPQTTTAFYVDGDLPVGGVVGDILQINVVSTSNPNLTVPGNATVFNGKSYDGLGSGRWTFDPNHREVRFKSIEDHQITGPYHLTYDNSIVPVGNLVIMLDGTANPNEQLQFRDGSVAGPVLYELALAPILSVRVLGGVGADVVTIDDINGLPSFADAVPAITGVGNNTFIGDTDGTPLPEFFFDAGGGINTLNLNLNSASTLQQWALGTGTGPAGSNEGELQTTNATTGLNAYVRNVNEINRTGIGGTPGGLTVFGDDLGNTINIADNTGGETRVSAAGYPSFDFSGNNYSSFVVNGQAGIDTIDLISFGSSQDNDWPITLNGNTGNDTIRVRSTSGNTGLVTLNGNQGSDHFQLYDGTVTAGTVDNIAGLVVVDGTDGDVANFTDTLTIIDNGDTTFDNVLISAVNPTVNADYAVEGINGLTGNDVTFRNVDVLNYTGTQGNDIIDGRFVNTTPTQHDLNIVSLSGWTGADQFYLFTSDQKGGTGVGFTPTNVASGVGMINLYGDAVGNPNAGDGNDIFGETPTGIVGTGVKNVGLVVSSDTRMIRPSATTGLSIDGGQPSGLFPPMGDQTGDKLNLDITALPNTNPVIVSTFMPGTVVATGIAATNWTQIEDMNLVDQNKLTNVQMGDLFARTTPGQDLIQLALNPTPTNPSQVRLRINATIANYSASNKTIVYSGGMNDTITQANLTIPAEFYGEEGNDNISGGIANDWLVGGLGNDRINGSRGDNVIWGDNSPTLPTDPQPQDLEEGGNDILSGLDGADVFYGGGGDDQVSAGDGNDYAYGGQGHDLLDGHDGDDRLYGGLGNDTLSGYAGNDLLVGNAGDDKLYGQEGNDVLFGGTGADLIDGGSGDDLLVSGSVGIENSSWTALASTGTYSAATYTRPSDNDFALITLLAQWGTFGNRGTLGTVPSITHDGENDDLFGGLGDDDFCWESADVIDNLPGISPPDFNAIAQGADVRFGPT